jgi:hypothetical protein
MKFNRLPELKKKLILSDRLDKLAKRERQLLFGSLRKVLELAGSLSHTNTGIVHQLARFIEENDLNVYDLVDEWLTNSPQSMSLSPAQRPKLFYRYIKYERLSVEDQIVHTVYLEVLKRFTSSRLSISMKEFKNLSFIEKLNQWFGKQVGNSVEDTLVDFLVVVLSEVCKFNKSLLWKPRTILGDFGWRTFNTWVEDNYGGTNGYALPTKDALVTTKQQREQLIKLARERYKVLDDGDIEEFDRLGKTIWQS